MLPPTRQLAEGFDRHERSGSPIPRGLIEQATRLWSELEASTTSPVVLHGDLHHDNILSASPGPGSPLIRRDISATRHSRPGRCCAICGKTGIV